MEAQTIEDIRHHAIADYPREACGVVAKNGDVERYFRCGNITGGNSEECFTLNPRDYAAAEDWGEVVAIVHSHPDATARASPTDLAMCDATRLPWHIFSYPEGDLRTYHPRDELPLIGRDFVLGVYDCWGLVMSWFQQTHGIILDDFRVSYPWWEDEYPDNFYHDCWYACGFREFDGPPRDGDLVIMQVQSNKWNHSGVLVDGGMLLHHLYGHLSKRAPYGGYWRDRTMKILRHKDLF
ncbi:TPA: C40 family peptidase [Klebsiella oxytoca]|nr:C40 family peptidase [Klebsiella oxytoca]HCD9002951.1 C40 family peptidase [Klebsiella oxytoca]